MAPWGRDSAKLALGPLVRFLDRFAVTLPDDSSLVAAAENPAWRKRFLETRLHRLPYEKVLSLIGRRVAGPPTRVTDRDWDALLVLDACRHDVFCHVYGEVPWIVSGGTDTIGWVRANFVENPDRERMADVALVTANPYNSRDYFRLKGWRFPFAEGYNLWKQAWNEAYSTVLPEDVARAAARVAQMGRPRILVHFIQPHFPPIGPRRFGAPDVAGPREEVLGEDRAVPRRDALWDLVRRGTLSLDEARALYEENLRLVLPWALGLARVLEGRVAITSDHGNLFGEYGLYWHPNDLWVPELCKVPWLELEGSGEGPSVLDEVAKEVEAFPVQASEASHEARSEGA